MLFLPELLGSTCLLATFVLLLSLLTLELGVFELGFLSRLFVVELVLELTTGDLPFVPFDEGVLFPSTLVLADVFGKLLVTTPVLLSGTLELDDEPLLLAEPLGP